MLNPTRYLLILLLLGLALAVPAAARTAGFDEQTVLVAMKKVMFQEPCCGVCPRMTGDQGRRLLSFLEGEDEPSGPNLWGTFGPKILAQLRNLDPAQADALQKVAEQRLADVPKE